MKRILVGLIGLAAACSSVFAQAPNKAFYGKTTAQFLAYCDSHREFIKTRSGDCSDAILMTSIVIMLTPAKAAKTCMPGGTDEEQSKLLGDVMSWLKAHKEVAATNHADAISTALMTLYPCH